MNSKILLVIVALIAVFGAFTFLSNNKKDVPSSTQQTESVNEATATTTEIQRNEKEVTIILTEEGFKPNDIIVKSGTKVSFLNKSGKAATVSSNDHPTHRLHTFLNLGEFPEDNYLEVTFDTVGKFGYHDHLNASSTGTITVE